jgi:hypothetical protein
MQLSTNCIDFKRLCTSVLVSHSFVMVNGSSFMKLTTLINQMKKTKTTDQGKRTLSQ